MCINISHMTLKCHEIKEFTFIEYSLTAKIRINIIELIYYF